MISEDAEVFLVYAAESDSDGITKINSISGLTISAGKWKFLDCEDDPREIARWKAVFRDLEKMGLIEDSNGGGEMYSVTFDGYNVADEMKAKLDIDTNNPPSEYLK